jgi:hypothetical protein
MKETIPPPAEFARELFDKVYDYVDGRDGDIDRTDDDVRLDIAAAITARDEAVRADERERVALFVEECCEPANAFSKSLVSGIRALSAKERNQRDLLKVAHFKALDERDTARDEAVRRELYERIMGVIKSAVAAEATPAAIEYVLGILADEFSAKVPR